MSSTATDSKNLTPLSYAVKMKSVEIVKLLVEKGADLSIKSRLKCLTPLDIARRNKLSKISEILVKKTLEIREVEEIKSRLRGLCYLLRNKE